MAGYRHSDLSRMSRPSSPSAKPCSRAATAVLVRNRNQTCWARS